MGKHHEVLIIGGGTAGLTVAARLLRKDKTLDIAIVEPSATHYYQPLWTLVGGGVFRKERSEKNTADYIPKGAHWLQEKVLELQPEKNRVVLSHTGELTYDYLVLAPGLQVDWQKVKGLEGNLGKNGICSIYAFPQAERTWATIREFKGGNAVFTFPNTPVKCGGAPQKIMYLAEHTFRKTGVREKAKIQFISAAASIFAVKKYAEALTKVIQKRAIETRFKQNLVEIDAEKKLAVFEQVESKERVTVPYDLLHVVPPMSAPDFVKQSGLVNAAGWVDVDKHSLRSVKFANVFSLGDASSLPTSKTGAAIRKQAPVLCDNLLAVRRGATPEAKYDGYTSCPLVTGYGKLILAEFDYDGNPRETFPFDQSKERLSMYLLKKYLLPLFYWRGMLRGRA